MLFILRAKRICARALPLLLAVAAGASMAAGQSAATGERAARASREAESPPRSDVSGVREGEINSPEGRKPSPLLALYFHPAQGASSEELVRRALTSNLELAAARLEIERARVRVRQASLRPNPTLDFEQTTGRLTSSPGESQTSIEVALPLELGGKRGRRIELARAEVEAVEAEVADRERRLASEVLAVHAEALAGLRELEITEELTELDLRTVVVVQNRVNEGDAAPIELNLLRAEVDRLRSRRALVEGRLRAALIRLKSLAGIPPEDSFRLREALAAPALPLPLLSLEAAIKGALRARPDLRLARLSEEVAQAGFRLASAQAAPEATAFTKYTQSRSSFDSTPVGPLSDRDKTLSFGVSVSIPVFNRNQGAKEEAALAIAQARTRREFVEATVRSEVASAYARYEAAQSALLTFEQGVIQRSADNIRTIRAAYEIGAFRVTDLIAEQRRLVDSQRDFTEALAERYRALADLQTATGGPVSQNPGNR